MTDDTLARARALIAAAEGHTPGPWDAACEPTCHAVVASLAGEEPRAVALILNDIKTPEREEMRFANARLIAAAPDAIALVAELAAEVERLRAEQEPRDYGTANNLAEVAEHYRLKGLARQDPTP